MIPPPPPDRAATGRRGEELAARYLQGLGWRLLDRNWRCRWGELDLVAQDGSCLVIVEVRTRASPGFGRGEDSVGPRKQARLVSLAGRYVAQKGWSGPQRIDVVAVDLTSPTAPRLTHYPNAVGP